MLPSYRLKNQEDYVVADEYNSYKSSAVKKMPPFIPTTDHSQRIGKLLPYITSMVSKIFVDVKNKESYCNLFS